MLRAHHRRRGCTNLRLRLHARATRLRGGEDNAECVTTITSRSSCGGAQRAAGYAQPVAGIAGAHAWPQGARVAAVARARAGVHPSGNVPRAHNRLRLLFFLSNTFFCTAAFFTGCEVTSFSPPTPAPPSAVLAEFTVSGIFCVFAGLA